MANQLLERLLERIIMPIIYWISEKIIKLFDKIRSLPSTLPVVSQRVWRGRERAIAVIAGVFLASLVITTVFAYGNGLSKAALKDGIEDLLFDGKVDFREDPGEYNVGRTNDSDVWESVCDELVQKPEFEDCGLVFGRQGIRVDNPFFDPGFIIAQPLMLKK